MSWTLYCSQRCKIIARRKQNQVRYKLLCSRCNKEFGSDRKTTKYCSVACAVRRYNYDEDAICEMAYNGLSLSDICTHVGLSASNVSRILSKKQIRCGKIIFETKLTNTQISIIKGGILGDAYLSCTSKLKYRVIFRHGPKQYDYLDWKYEQLKNLTRTAPRIRKTPKAFGKESKSFSTLTNKTVTEIAMLYNRKRMLSREFLDSLDALAITVWILDDGSLHKNGGSLSTHNFSLYENRIISSWFSDRYETREPRIGFDKRCGLHYLVFHTEMAKRIANEISPYIIHSMNYKVSWHG